MLFGAVWWELRSFRKQVVQGNQDQGSMARGLTARGVLDCAEEQDALS